MKRLSALLIECLYKPNKSKSANKEDLVIVRSEEWVSFVQENRTVYFLQAQAMNDCARLTI